MQTCIFVVNFGSKQFLILLLNLVYVVLYGLLIFCECLCDTMQTWWYERMMFWYQVVQIPHTQIFIFSLFLFLSLSKIKCKQSYKITCRKKLQVNNTECLIVILLFSLHDLLLTNFSGCLHSCLHTCILSCLHSCILLCLHSCFHSCLKLFI